MRERDGRAGPLHPRTRERARRACRGRRQGDRADQPPRLRRPTSPAARCGHVLGVPRLRRLARPAPGQRAPRLPPLRPPRAGAAARARLRLGDARPRAAPGPSGSRRDSPRGWRRCRSSASTPTAPRAPAATLGSSQRFEAAPTRASWSAPRWSPRATTSPTSTLGRRRSTPTRPCASPTSAPRSGPSRWSPSSPGAAAAAGRGGEVLVQTLAPGRRGDPRTPPRHDAAGFLAGELERRARAALPAVLAPDPGRALAWPTGAGSSARPASLARGLASGSRAGASALGPAPLFRLRGRERRQRDRQGRRAARGAVDAVRDAVEAGSPPASCARLTVVGRRRPAVSSAYGHGRARTRRSRSAETIDATTEVEDAPAHERRLSEAERERRSGALALVASSATRCCARRASEVTDFDAELAERGRADGRDHARRDGRRPRRHPARACCGGCSSSRPAPTARPTALVNPEIEWLSDELATAEEGCLSLPRRRRRRRAAAPRAGRRRRRRGRADRRSRPPGSRRGSSSTRSTTSTAS